MSRIGLTLVRLHTTAALFHHFKEPIMLVEGKQQWLFDETGRRYLDVSYSAAPLSTSVLAA